MYALSVSCHQSRFFYCRYIKNVRLTLPHNGIPAFGQKWWGAVRICNICWSLWLKYFHHGQFEAIRPFFLRRSDSKPNSGVVSLLPMKSSLHLPQPTSLTSIAALCGHWFPNLDGDWNYWRPLAKNTESQSLDWDLLTQNPSRAWDGRPAFL